MAQQSAKDMITTLERAGFSNDQIVGILSEMFKPVKAAPTRTTASLKVKVIEENMIGGYVAVYTDPKNVDYHGEFFTPRTNFRLETTYTRIPIYWQHGNDRKARREVGSIVGLIRDDLGVKIRFANLFEREKDLIKLCKKGGLYWSSATNVNISSRLKSGELIDYPIIECSLTTSPAGGKSVKTATTRAEAVKAQNTHYRALVYTRLQVLGMDESVSQWITANIPDPWTA